MSINLVPISIAASSAGVSIKAKPDRFVRAAFSEIKVGAYDGSNKNVTIKESDLEELIRCNVELLSTDADEESKTSMLIIGQQTANAAGGRPDLIAIDSTGAIVLIELKRDKADMGRRPEPMELQAIRYAASFAKIKSKQELIDKLFAPYVAKHKAELQISGREGLTERQIAEERLSGFLSENKLEDQDINRTQRVVLLASQFDEQTLSACAWLVQNKVDISCLEVYPMRLGLEQDYLLAVEQIIPPPSLEDFLVGIPQANVSGGSRQISTDRTARTTLPKLPQLIEWGIVSLGDELRVPKHPTQSAILRSESTVEFQGATMPINAWAKLVTGWSAVNIYQWVEVVAKEKTLDELRAEKLRSLELSQNSESPQ